MTLQRKTMTNAEIYNIGATMLDVFQNLDDIKWPVKVHFYFQKNMNNIVTIAQEIDKSRISIFEKYGTLDQETQNYKFENDCVEDVNRDISELFELSQEVKIYPIPLEWFDDADLTAKQSNALAFMIEDPFENDEVEGE